MWNAIGGLFSNDRPPSSGGGRSNGFPRTGLGPINNRYASPFKISLVAYPSSFMENKDHLEDGDKIILPSTSLYELSIRNVTYPMTFKIENTHTQRVIHAGVLEFVAEEGTCFMPLWMMKNLLLRDGDIVTIESVGLPKGKSVKLQPCSKTFLDVENHKELLERSLVRFSCLTVGELLPIKYNTTVYEVEVLEMDPRPAACIIECDLTVEFAPPKDWTCDDENPANSVAEDLPLHDENGNYIEPHPWKYKLPGGMRVYDEGYERMVQEGRIPGVIRDRKLQETLHAKNAFMGQGTALGSRS